MGFFDKLTDTINKAVDKASSPEAREALDKTADIIGKKANAVIENLFGSGGTQSAAAQPSVAPQTAPAAPPAPPKPSKERSYEAYLFKDEKEYTVRVSYMLSADFVQSKTNAGEIDELYLYDPACSDEYSPYSLNDNRPQLFLSPDIDEVFCAVNEYIESGSVEGTIWVRPSEHPNMLFRAKREYYGDYMLMYGYKRDDRSPGGICLVYDKALDGTEILDRMITEMDEMAASYREVEI